jgi:alkylation response protein AidB-like acyl-CoA dehydrogenase
MYQAAARAKDGKMPEPKEVAIAKYIANNVLSDVSSRCVQLQGAYGTTTESMAQRIHRDSLVNKVAGGSTPVLLNVIAAQIIPDRRFQQKLETAG